MQCDLSIILPSIRPHLIQQFYDSIPASVGNYSFELIIVGPHPTYGIRNIRHIVDLGSPARCLQIGAVLAEGEFLTWASDDGLYQPNGLKDCIDLLKTKKSNDGIIVRYSEGVGRSGQMPPDNYWTGWTHPDHRLGGVNPAWKIAPVGLYYRNHFLLMGGLDCQYEHANMNSHDFCYRNQKMGGEYYMSPGLVMACDQMPGYSGDHGPVEDAYALNDRDLFAKMWGEPNDRTVIPLNNWQNAEAVWKRRFK